MEIKVNKKGLVNSLNKVGRAIINNPTIPVLSGIKLVANKDHLEITGSDGNITVITKVNNDDHIEIKEGGATILPAKEFMSIAKVMPEETISITVQENKAVIKSGKSNFKLKGREISEYPKLKIIKTNEVKVDSDIIRNLFQKSGYCVSKSETRPIFTGVNMSFDDGVISVVSTDAHRLSKVIGGEFEGHGFEDSVTIPPKAIKEIPHLLSGEIVEISRMDNNNIVFEMDDTVVVSRLLSGDYPDTNRLIPESHNTRVKINRKSFIDSLERASLLRTDGTPIVSIEITNDDNAMFKSIKLAHKSHEIGASEEDVLVEKIEGEDISLSFSPNYMLDALKHIDEDEVYVNFTSPMTPFTVIPTDNEEVLKLVLPVKTF